MVVLIVKSRALLLHPYQLIQSSQLKLTAQLLPLIASNSKLTIGSCSQCLFVRPHPPALCRSILQPSVSFSVVIVCSLQYGLCSVCF